MIYLVDTNVLIEAARTRPHPRVQSWLERTAAPQLVLCPVAVGEFMAGAFRLPAPRRREAVAFLRGCLSGWSWLPLDRRAGVIWGQRRAVYRARPRVNDLWLGALALAHGLVMATRNGEDFRRHAVPTFNPFQ
jgi:predicted nucleic acid-binding protein